MAVNTEEEGEEFCVPVYGLIISSRAVQLRRK